MSNSWKISPRTKYSLIGRGCEQCAIDNLTKTTEEFICESKLIHGDKYDYSLVDYINSQTKITIKCKVKDHVGFKLYPNRHLSGYGCPICNKYNQRGYSLKDAKLGRYKFSGFIYFIKLYNEKESFYKIGISKKLKQRIKSIKNDSKYNVEVIKTEFFDDFNKSIIKEYELHNKYEEYSYNPKNSFGGYTECFDLENQNILSKVTNEF